MAISPASVDVLWFPQPTKTTNHLCQWKSDRFPPISPSILEPHEAIPFLWKCRYQETPGLLRLPRHKHLQRLGRSSRTWDMSHVIGATCQHLNSQTHHHAHLYPPVTHHVSPICFGKHPSSILDKHYCLLLKGIAFPTVEELLSK